MLSTNMDLTMIESAIWCLLLWLVGRGIWDVFLHPLSGFPGPRMAALTTWYKFYFDVIRDGVYLQHFPGWHDRFGTGDLSVRVRRRFRHLNVNRSNHPD